MIPSLLLTPGRAVGRSFRRTLRLFASPLRAGARRLDEPVAARLRAAQIAALTRYSGVTLAGSIAVALVLFLALGARASAPLALPWFCAAVVLQGSALYRIYKRRHRAPPLELGPGAIRKAEINAALLGVLWGAAPALFFDAAQRDELIVVSVTTGMLCAGALALATMPRAVVFYTGPMVVGCLIGLARGAHDPMDLLVLPLLLAYFAILTYAALSHASQFAQRVVAQARAESAARHDPLTGLPNRTAFAAALSEAYRRLDRYGEPFALLYIDLDDFKGVNDRMGHLAGDQLLQQMAGRLAGRLREKDTLCRLGGDEFALLARGLGEAQEAAALASALAHVFEAPFVLEGGSAYCRASVGVALAPGDGATAAALLSHADAALYMAKRDRTARSHLYRAGEDGEARERRALAQDLKGALGRGEFFLQFQPIVDLATSRMEAAEALVRWRHPVRGIVPPSLFIPIAEQTGAIHELGEWIMFEACRVASAWPRHVAVAVNVSAEQICDQSIVAIVENALREGRIGAERLHVEVTESAAFGTAQGTCAAIERLSERGVAIALDDFGTGYSSFDHIRRLPVKSLKIDRSFVGKLPARKSRAIVQAVSHLAQALEIDVTAEGIETPTQLDFLRAAGCRFGQGYLLARPQDAGEIDRMARERAAA